MKILRIVSAGYEQGGVENGIVLTNRLLRERGHEVRVISSDARPDLPHYSDYEFRALPDSGIKKIISSAFNYDAYRLTRRVLKEFSPDVVLGHTLQQPTASVLFSLRKYPTILFVHGPEIYTKTLLRWHLNRDDYRDGSYELADLTAVGRLHYWYFRYVCGRLYRLAWKSVDKVVALSSYTLSFLRQEGIEASYVPNGAMIRSPMPLPSADPLLLYAGRLEKFKGVDCLIRALPAVVEQVPGTTLLIVGEGGYEAELKRLVKELGLERYVTFLGQQNQDELEESYRKCHVFVLPSVWPETFGKVGIEAMGIGRPVIASDVGGVRDWLVDGVNGFLVPPDDPRRLAERIVAVLADRELLISMAREAHRTAEKFSIDSFADSIERLAKASLEARFRALVRGKSEPEVGVLLDRPVDEELPEAGRAKSAV